MVIVELTKRYGNNFHFISECQHCGDRDHWGDGYADAYYQQVVFPHRHCRKCGKDHWGDTAEPDMPLPSAPSAKP